MASWPQLKSLSSPGRLVLFITLCFIFLLFAVQLLNNSYGVVRLSQGYAKNMTSHLSLFAEQFNKGNTKLGSLGGVSGGSYSRSCGLVTDKCSAIGCTYKQHGMVSLVPYVTNVSVQNSMSSSAKNEDYFLMEGSLKIKKSAVQMALDNLHDPSSHPLLSKMKCQECVVVGSGGCLRNKNLGAKIDSYPVVIRVNKPPLKGYEHIVGTKTDIRVVYPESSPSDVESFKGQGLVYVVPYKTDDFLWAAKLANSNLNISMHFWAPSPLKLPVDSHDVVLSNPELSESLFYYMKKLNKGGSARPTNGFIAVQIALNLCNKVAVAGFCYNTDQPGAYAYYYGSDKMESAFTIGPHSRVVENKVRSQLINQKLIQDLTHSII